MFKEEINNSENIFQNHLSDIKKLVEYWNELNNSNKTQDGLDEGDVRNLEEKIIPNLILFLENNPSFLESKKDEIEFIGKEYLEMGDCADLAKKFAKIIGASYYDPFTDDVADDESIGPSGAQKQVQKEINETDEKLN